MSRPPTRNRHRGRSNSRSTSSRRGRQRASDYQPLFPAPDSQLPQIVLAKRTTHPNVFRKRIQQIIGQPAVGDWVVLYHTDTTEETPELFAYGVFNPKSEIAVRIVRWSNQLPDEVFWSQLLDRAIRLRRDTLQLDNHTDCYRLLHAEADGTPGLVVDRYANCLSAEVFSVAMGQRAPEIIERLAKQLDVAHWLIQPGPHMQSQEGFETQLQSSADLPPQITVQEYGVRYRVHFSEGHKTGFFCDQRDNRRQLAEYCRGKSVLDVCCYTGGFSIMAAARGQATAVTGVDLDAAPLALAKQNAALNNCRIKFTQADAFAYMRDMLRGGKQFDLVVLDPPKLIRNRGEMDEGTRKHFDLNRLAMQLVKPGGMMLTCSCAGLLPAQEFTRLVRAAARSAFLPTDYNPNPVPRQMQILTHSGAAMCHPVSANCPETEYLKAMWLRL